MTGDKLLTVSVYAGGEGTQVWWRTIEISLHNVKN